MDMKKLWPLLVLFGMVGLGLWWFRAFDSGDLGGQKRVVWRPGASNDDFVEWEVQEFVAGLEVPWSMRWTSGDRLIVSERAGRIREIVDGTLVDEPLIEFAEVSSQAEEGLMGLALDPEYDSNGFVYACMAYPGGGGLFTKVVRLVNGDSGMSLESVVIDRIPAARFHAGCALEFGPDGKLYVSTGDATNKALAQDLNSLAGKILRVNPDGSVPEDNPYPDSLVFSYGHRNPQGLAFHLPTGELWSSEHGPSVFDGPAGGDEINRIEAGANYGWPKISHNNEAEGMQKGLAVFTPAEAPGSGMFYGGDKFPQWTDSFWFGALKGESLFRVEVTEDGKDIAVIERIVEKTDGYGRIRAVTQGPNGLIYFGTSNLDGRGEARDGDDRIMVIKPVFE